MRSVMITVCLFVYMLCGSAFAEQEMVSPIHSVRYEPEPFHVLSGITVTPNTDTEIDYFEYRWILNGEEIDFEDSSFLPGHLLKRGDQLAVEIIAFDEHGETPPFITLPLQVGNAPPVIQASPQGEYVAGQFKGKVFANDPDGDPLEYSLLEGPQGFVVDCKNGTFTWEVPPSETGSYNVKVGIADGFGGKAEQSFEFNLSQIYHPKEKADE